MSHQEPLQGREGGPREHGGDRVPQAAGDAGAAEAGHAEEQDGDGGRLPRRLQRERAEHQAANGGFQPAQALRLRVLVLLCACSISFACPCETRACWDFLYL